MSGFCSRAADCSPSSEAKAVSLWPAWISFMSWWFLCFSIAKMLKLFVRGTHVPLLELQLISP